MELTVNLYNRPNPSNPRIVEQITAIAHKLTGEWFTSDVPEAVPNDLKFHDSLCLEVDNRVASFITFTSLDGSLYLALVGTDPSLRGLGYGSKLMEALFDHARNLGFTDIVVQTVPPSQNPNRIATVGFYQKLGFVIEKEFKELWESGALQLRKKL